jgi:hypothetical protein
MCAGLFVSATFIAYGGLFCAWQSPKAAQDFVHISRHGGNRDVTSMIPREVGAANANAGDRNGLLSSSSVWPEGQT